MAGHFPFQKQQAPPSKQPVPLSTQPRRSSARTRPRGHRGVPPPDRKRPAGEPGKPKRTPLEEAREELYQKQLALLRPLRTKTDADSVAAHEALLGREVEVRHPLPGPLGAHRGRGYPAGWLPGGLSPNLARLERTPRTGASP